MEKEYFVVLKSGLHPKLPVNVLLASQSSWFLTFLFDLKRFGIKCLCISPVLRNWYALMKSDL